MQYTGCSSALFSLFSLAHCRTFPASLSFKLMQAVSSLAFDTPGLARRILQPRVMRAVLGMHAQLQPQQRTAVVSVINVAVQWGVNSSLQMEGGHSVDSSNSVLGDEVVGVLLSHLDRPDALTALHTLCDAVPLHAHVLSPSPFIRVLLQPRYWNKLSSQILGSSKGAPPGLLATQSLSLVRCMLDHQWEDAARAIGNDASLIIQLSLIWSHGQVSPVARAQALSLVAAAAAGPAADVVLDLFVRNNSIASAAADAVVLWEDMERSTKIASVSAMELIVLQQATAAISSLCSGQRSQAVEPSSYRTPPLFLSAVRVALCEGMLSSQLIDTALRLVLASSDAVSTLAVTIIHTFTAVSSRNRLRLLSAGAVQTLTHATTSGQPAVRAGALHALALLILPNDAFASAAAADGADVHAVNAAAATRSHIDALLPALLSAASSGELLISAAIPLLHYVVVILDAVEHFVMKLVIIIQQQQQQSPLPPTPPNPSSLLKHCPFSSHPIHAFSHFFLQWRCHRSQQRHCFRQISSDAALPSHFKNRVPVQSSHVRRHAAGFFDASTSGFNEEKRFRWHCVSSMNGKC